MPNKRIPIKKLINHNSAKSLPGSFHRPEGAGNFDNMDDFNVVKHINIQSGTVDRTPTDDKHIVNKKYVDDMQSQVCVMANDTSGQSVPNATYHTITYNGTEGSFSCGTWNGATGTFTASEGGVYQVNVSVLFDNATWPTLSIALVRIKTAGVFNTNKILIRNTTYYGGAGAFYKGLNGSECVLLAAGDTIQIEVYHNRGAAVGLYPSAEYNHLSIFKV